jgi:HK97 family phage prohead protease
LFLYLHARFRRTSSTIVSVYKTLSQSFKDVDASKRFMSGYFSDFHQKDSDGDIIRYGAYAKTIAEGGIGSQLPRIKHLIDHDRSRPLTVLTVLKEDEKGLYYEGRIGRHADAKDFVLKVEDGFITEHSVYFNAIHQHYDKAQEANIITECKLWEGSSLHCWGANSATPFLGFKSEKAMVEEFERLYKALHHGTYTDTTMLQFQAQYDAIGKLLKTMQPSAEDETTASDLSQDQSKNLIELFKNTSLNGINH